MLNTTYLRARIEIMSQHDIFAVLFAIFMGYSVIYAVYNLFFHSLARCPGPLMAKISTLPNLYHSIKGDRHIWIWQIHQIYGDKVRINPNTVVFLNTKAFRDIYGAKANVRRAKSYEAWKSTKEFNTILTIDPADHARKKRVLGQAFTDKSVKHAASFMTQHAERWIDLLLNDADKSSNDGWTISRNMSEWNDWVVFDILGDLCFGRSFEIKEPKPNPIRKIPHLVTRHAQLFYPVLQSPFMDFFVWAKPRGLDSLLNLITPDEIKAYYKFIDDSVSERQEKGKNSEEKEKSRLDMLHFLRAARDPLTGKPYSEDMLRAEAIMLVVAGSDSVSGILAGFWFYITRNRVAYARLTNEIRNIFHTSEEISLGPKLSSCTYLHACIDESLRMIPGGSSEMPREVLQGGITIDGDYYPQGVVVGCSGWAMGRNEDVFGDPNRFRPERYIPSETSNLTIEDVNFLKSSYHPFMMGATSCIGKNIALTELAVLIARTLFRVDMRVSAGEDLGAGHPSLGWGRRDKNQYQINDAYINIHQGPMIQFKKRA